MKTFEEVMESIVDVSALDKDYPDRNERAKACINFGKELRSKYREIFNESILFFNKNPHAIQGIAHACMQAALESSEKSGKSMDKGIISFADHVGQATTLAAFQIGLMVGIEMEKQDAS